MSENKNIKKCSLQELAKEKRKNQSLNKCKLKRDIILFNKRKIDCSTEIKQYENITNLNSEVISLLKMIKNSKTPQDCLNPMTNIRALFGLDNTIKNVTVSYLEELNMLDLIINLIMNNSLNIVRLQCEMIWILNNISTCGIQCIELLLNKNIINVISYLLSELKKIDFDNWDNNHMGILEQCCLLIGNITYHNPEFRDKNINDKLMEFISNILVIFMKKSSNVGLLSFTRINDICIDKVRNIVWMFSVICKSKPYPNNFPVDKFIKLFNHVLNSECVFDKAIVRFCCLGILYITDKSPKNVTLLLNNNNMIKIFFEILKNNAFKVYEKYLALQIIGNVTTGTDSEIQIVLDLGIIPIIKKMITYHDSQIKLECIWILSNIAAGTQSQSECIFKSDLLPPIMNILNSKNASYNIKNEIVWLLANLSFSNNVNDVIKLVKMNCIDAVYECLDYKSNGIIKGALLFINNVLMADIKDVEISKEKIETLSVSEYDEISKIASEILKNYYSDDTMEL